MKTFKAAAIQMISGPEVAANCETAARLISEAVAEGAQLVVLPEYFAIMGHTDRDKLAVAEAFGQGPLQTFLADEARKHGIWLVGGSIPLVSPEAGKVLNTSLVFDPQGTLKARYDKIHLFGFDGGHERYCESDTILPGMQPCTFDTPFGRIGLAICYDLRFPELFRAVGEVDVWLLPAAFTATTGAAHWEVLLRSRAIENQCYVVAPGQGGVHPSGRHTYGNSMIIDPWGQILARAGEGRAVLVRELKSSQLQRVRTSLPALKHRVL